MTVSINTVAIPNLDVKVRTRKIEFPEGNFLRSLNQTEITRQRPFKLTGINYELIKYEIERMKCVE